MKTTQGKAVKAYIALSNMSAKTLPSGVAFRLYKLKKSLQDSFDFETEEEKKYVKELGGEITETGQIIMTDKEQKNQFEQKRKELEATEIDVEYDPTVILISELKEISMSDLEALEGFVSIK